MNIPLFDLTKQYLECKAEIDDVFASISETGRYLFGEQTEKLESELAEYLGVDAHIVTCGSGTDALILSLLAENIGPGDEVIIPTTTAIPTATAVITVGATPVFADVNPDTWLLGDLELQSCVTKNTKAVIAVHLYGNVCDMGKLIQFTKKHKLLLIEDAAQAFDASYQKNKVGTMADYGAFSFYPTKNLGAMGDGGAVFCRDKEGAERIRKLRFYGQGERFVIDLPRGLNSRMDEFQAAILRVKLRKIQKWTQIKKSLDESYRNSLRELSEYRSQSILPEVTPSWHLKVIRMKPQLRESIMSKLKAMGIGCDIHYPAPLHLQPCYKRFVRNALPESEKLAREILSVPMHPHMSEKDVSAICQALQI